MNCPLCQSESKFAFEAKGFNLLDCENCSHRFAEISADEEHVAKTYDDSYFNGGGAGYSDYLAESEMIVKRGKMYAEKIVKFTDKKGKVLDVGAAAGFILQGFIDEGWIGIGLEPNAEIAKTGSEKFGLDIRQGSLESFETDEKFDLILMIQVVAHFYEPGKAFENAAKLLNKDGFLLVETWNRESFSARIFGKNWHQYSPPSVLQWFSPDELNCFLQDFGFEKVSAGATIEKDFRKTCKIAFEISHRG